MFTWQMLTSSLLLLNTACFIVVNNTTNVKGSFIMVLNVFPKQLNKGIPSGDSRPMDLWRIQLGRADMRDDTTLAMV